MSELNRAQRRRRAKLARRDNKEKVSALSELLDEACVALEIIAERSWKDAEEAKVYAREKLEKTIEKYEQYKL